MEHALPQKPWRVAALVATGIAALELALLVSLALPALGREVADQVRSAAEEKVLAPAPVRPKPAAAALPREDTSVLVLNGNGVAGAANAAGARVHDRGYIVAGTGNAPRTDYPRTIVMYRPGREGEGRRLARDLRVRVVGPLDGLKPSELMGAHVVLVLGAR